MSRKAAARRLLVGLCLVLALGFAALGVWQIERRAWKLDLIARVEARIHAPVRELPSAAEWNDELVYTRVHARGVFLHDRETLVQAVTERGGGWWVLTPLATREGIVLINRGFVPPERRDPATRLEGQLQGAVNITGLLRASEEGGGFLRSNDPAAERWYSRDVAAIGRDRKLSRLLPFFVDADDTIVPGGYPVGGLTVVSFRNAHLSYALTWFALSALSIFGAFLFFRSRGQS